MKNFFSDQIVENCKVIPRGEILAIEKAKPLESRSAMEEEIMRQGTPKRRRAVICENCSDDQYTECKECGCKVCGGKYDSHVLLLCDECNYAFHLRCLNPPLVALPDDDYWFCPGCKRDENEIVKVNHRCYVDK